MTNFKQLFKEELSKYVGVNITTEEANETYKHILKHVKDIENITSISIDGNENIHYFFVTSLGNSYGSPKGIFRTHTKGLEDGKGNTLILRGVQDTQILEVGKTVTDKNGRTFTVLVLGDENNGYNQSVTIKNKNGTVIKTIKHKLLGL